MQPCWEHLKAVSVSQLFGAIHEMNPMDLCPSSMTESLHGKKKKSADLIWNLLAGVLAEGKRVCWMSTSLLLLWKTSLALGQSWGSPSGWWEGKQMELVSLALLGEAELTAGINSWFPPVHMHTRVHTQDNLTTAEETSHVLVATSMVPAAPWSASSSLLHTPWSARLYPRGSAEMWNCTVKSSGHQHGSQKRGLGLSTGLSNLQPFPAAQLPGEVCLAVGNAVAIGRGVMVL